MLTCGPPCSPPRLQVSSFLPHIGLIQGYREKGSLPPDQIATPISSPQGSELPGTSRVRRFCRRRGLAIIYPRTCPSSRRAYPPILFRLLRAYPFIYFRLSWQDRWPGCRRDHYSRRRHFRFATRWAGPQSLPFARSPRADLLLCLSLPRIVRDGDPLSINWLIACDVGLTKSIEDATGSVTVRVPLNLQPLTGQGLCPT